MASNRFIDRNNPKETSRVDLNTTLLDIMQKEFPNDPLYSQGYLTPRQITARTTSVPPFNEKEVTVATRNSLNVLQIASGSKTYAEYILDKSYPTVNDKDLDDLMDEGWDFYIKTDIPRPVPPTGLFLVNTEIELNPVDWHDAYLQYGPSTIITRLNEDIPEDDVIRTTFCVYYIENGRALPIPNYQTLEVMLVERGKTYGDIQEATPEQVQQFDMTLDGTYDGDPTLGKPNPIEEFEFRKVLDRSTDWNYQVRFESGYRPKAPFYRDPGDYLKPAGYKGTGASDIYLVEDPRDLYFDQVFQKQTYREKLRTKYEGKMIILDWPIPYNDALVNSGTGEIQSDDLVFGLRMMINGFWKQVTDEDVARTYAALNNFSLAEYQLGQGRYGENGWLNLLIEAGGIEVLKTDGLGRPVWNDFPHILEADRLDIFEYRDYIDNYSNSTDPFNIEYLKPYEPEGSIAYYPVQRVQILQQQAAFQAELDSLKADIQEYWPKLAARTALLESIINSQPSRYSDYYIQKLGPNSPVYKIITADQPYLYVKKKRRFAGYTHMNLDQNLLALFERCERISAGAFNKPGDADQIVGISQWGIVLSTNETEWSERTRAGKAAIIAAAVVNPVLTGGILLIESLSDVGNTDKYELPRNKAGIRKRGLLKDANYIRSMIALRLGVRETELNLTDRVKTADDIISSLRIDVQIAKDFLLEIDDLLLNADSLEAFQDIYTRILALNADLDAFSDEDLTFCNTVRTDIDSMLVDQLRRLYDAVQYFRQRVHDEIGNKSKFGVQWSTSARDIINQYIPGKTFDNYLPTIRE